ncbi:MAG: aldehyde dehydrogenase family protein [Bacteroidia bacterium]|nr:aldehyde dehydrogenase family protein [Bacteroidia bacterium]
MAKTKSTTTRATRTTAETPQVVAQPEANGQDKPGRLGVQKTYKLYIGGQFPRTESGRYYRLTSADGKLAANICRGSRKDFRNAVVAARSAFHGWSGRSHANRGQILYRIGEMLEGRKAQFVEELVQLGSTREQAENEVFAAIDRCIHYAGWCDKYQQIFSAVNPVASSHFNFSVLEPMGVVSAFAPEETGLLGLVSAILPAIAGGNTIVILASESRPTSAISFAEVVNSSDVPGGVVNILTGLRSELKGHFSTHMDVNAMIYCGNDPALSKELQINSVENIKRLRIWDHQDWSSSEAQSPYKILDLQETKTTWHPVGI